MSELDLTRARFFKEIRRPEDLPRPERPSVAFAGRSNVGKSSLINALVRQKGLARTSSTPGRTQSIVFFDIDGRVFFVDLPGYGYARVPPEVRGRWGPLVESFLERAQGLRLVVIVLDIRREPSEGDLRLLELLNRLGHRSCFALTKADKLPPGQRDRRARLIRERLGLAPEAPLQPFSAQTGLGRPELVRLILEALRSNSAT